MDEKSSKILPVVMVNKKQQKMVLKIAVSLKAWGSRKISKCRRYLILRGLLHLAHEVEMRGT
jgi:hypothetical protein